MSQMNKQINSSRGITTEIIISFILVIAILLISINILSKIFLPPIGKTRIENNDFFNEIKDLRGLSFEECRLLISFKLRSDMETIGAEGISAAGKTIDQIVEAQLIWEMNLIVEEAIRKANEMRDTVKKDIEKKSQNELKDRLLEIINLTVTEKTFEEQSTRRRVEYSRVMITCLCKNLSDKPIRAFRGKIKFFDLFDSYICAVDTTITNTIAGGADLNWMIIVKFNQFMESHMLLRDINLNNTKVVWEPHSVLFEDGTQIGE